MSIMVFTIEQDAYSLVQRIAVYNTTEECGRDADTAEALALLDDLILEARALVRKRRGQ